MNVDGIGETSGATMMNGDTQIRVEALDRIERRNRIHKCDGRHMKNQRSR